MSAPTVATMHDFKFLFEQQNRMTGSHYASQAAKQLIQGSPLLNLTKSTPNRPIFDQAQFAVIHKPTRLPTVQQQPIQPPVQRRDSIKSDSSQQSDANRYKTELCRPFEETGHCRYGSKCQFAHGMPELRSLNRHPKYKTELCRTFHTTGFCSYGQRCNFIHNEEERRSSSSTTPPVSPQLQRPQGLVLSTHQTGCLGSTGHSPASSVNGDSPSHSPTFINDDVFHARLSPTPSFGSDISSSSFNSLPSPTISHSHDPFESSLSQLGFQFSLFDQLSL